MDEARRRTREAMALVIDIDDADPVGIVDDVKLPRDAKNAITACAKLRKKADSE